MIARSVPVLLALLILAGCGGENQCGGGAKSSLSVWAEQEHLIGAAFSLTGAEPEGQWRVVAGPRGPRRVARLGPRRRPRRAEGQAPAG